MNYTYKIIRKNELTTAVWSGGTTTQLAIYPENALYSERNFLWRISTAKIEVDESVFTSLPNIHRIIMILEGKVLLKHEGHGEVFLEPYQQDSFMGNHVTRSYGQVTDFNLMMANGCKGSVKALTINPSSNKEVSIFNMLGKEQWNNIVEVFYFTSKFKAALPNNEYTDINCGDVLIAKPNTKNNNAVIGFFNPLATHCHIIKTCICFNT